MWRIVDFKKWQVQNFWGKMKFSDFFAVSVQNDGYLLESDNNIMWKYQIIMRNL